MWFFKIFFQILVYLIELRLIFCKFRSYERSELQAHEIADENIDSNTSQLARLCEAYITIGK